MIPGASSEQQRPETKKAIYSLSMKGEINISLPCLPLLSVLGHDCEDSASAFSNHWSLRFFFSDLLPKNVSSPHPSVHMSSRTFPILSEKSVLTSAWNNKRGSSYKYCHLVQYQTLYLQMASLLHSTFPDAGHVCFQLFHFLTSFPNFLTPYSFFMNNKGV